MVQVEWDIPGKQDGMIVIRQWYAEQGMQENSFLFGIDAVRKRINLRVIRASVLGYYTFIHYIPTPRKQKFFMWPINFPYEENIIHHQESWKVSIIIHFFSL